MQTVQIGDCQIWGKIMKIASNQFHMARFGPIIAQNRSHRLWGASGMPPRPQNPSKIKNPGFRGLGGQAPLFSLRRQARITFAGGCIYPFMTLSSTVGMAREGLLHYYAGILCALEADTYQGLPSLRF